MAPNSHDQAPTNHARAGQWKLFAVWALIFGIGIGFFAGYVVGVEVGRDSVVLLNGENATESEQ